MVSGSLGLMVNGNNQHLGLGTGQLKAKQSVWLTVYALAVVLGATGMDLRLVGDVDWHVCLVLVSHSRMAWCSMTIAWRVRSCLYNAWSGLMVADT
jgi:hypothetical protein